jgi:hypothetical protein
MMAAVAAVVVVGVVVQVCILAASPNCYKQGTPKYICFTKNAAVHQGEQ